MPTPPRLTAMGRLALLFLVTCGTWASEVDPQFHLFLLIGQSNMAGRGVPDAESREVDPRVLMLDREQRWVPAQDPLHFDKPEAGVGPGLAFGKQLAAADSRVRIGLIPCAVGGTSIARWVPGAFDPATKTHPYDDMLVRAKAALGQGVLKGILWHQGEADRGKTASYPEDLTALVQRLRGDLATPEVIVLAGELAAFTPKQEAATTAFNATLHGLTGKIPRFDVVSAANLQHKGDHLHFDTASARTLGIRFAEVMVRLQQSNNPAP